MTFSYSSTIPASGNDPADDQPFMQTNFASIASLIAVDHVGFNTPSGGDHKQVTFFSNNVPTLPTTPPVLFTNVPATSPATTLPELFFYSGDTAHSSSQYIALTTGSTMALGGIIIKWGTNAITNTSQNFASSFPNAAFAMTVTSTDAALGSPLKVTALNASSYTVTRSGSGATGYYYIAIGN